MQASGYCPDNYAERLTEINREITQIGKQMKALTILKENLRVLLEDKKEYLDILENCTCRIFVKRNLTRFLRA